MRYNQLYLYSKCKVMKTAILNLRISPPLKEGIKLAAEKEHRSIANMVEMLIRRHCDDCGIEVTDKYTRQKESSHG